MTIREICVVTHCKEQFCVCVCFKTSETTGSTSVKHGTIDHHFGESVIRGVVTSPDVTIYDNF